MTKKWFVWFIPLIVILSGCDERYRYPCQDPDNWNEKICQKPHCSANGTCPEDLTHYEKKNISLQLTPQTPSSVKMNKGGCI